MDDNVGLALRAQVEPFVDLLCQDSCLVFVNGHYASSLSRVARLPPELKVDFVDGRSSQSLSGAAAALFASPIERAEQPRDQFGSDYLAALNMVICRHFSCCSFFFFNCNSI